MCHSMSCRRLFNASRCVCPSSALPGRFQNLSTISKRLNVAVVGTGRMGRIRLAGMQNNPRVSIAAIVDSNAITEQLEELSSQYSTKCFKSLVEAGNALKEQHETVDGVWISTPTPTHLELVIGCATGVLGSKVKAIGIENPVATLVADIDTAYQVCHRKNVKLFCSFQRRFDPSYEALRVQCVAYGYDQRIEVAGEHGMMQVHNMSKTGMVQSTKAGITADTLRHSFPERYHETYLLELDSFVKVVNGSMNPRVHWSASRMNTIIAEAARIAAVEKKVVTIKYSKTKQLQSSSDPVLECEYVF